MTEFADRIDWVNSALLQAEVPFGTYVVMLRPLPEPLTQLQVELKAFNKQADELLEGKLGIIDLRGIV